MFPEISASHGAYTLVGMGAVAGAVLGAPISTILIVFEMTSDYALTVALMVAVVLASVVTEQLVGRSFFIWQLARRGVSLRGGRETSLLQAIRVGDVMKRDHMTVRPEVGRGEVAAALTSARHGEVFVVEADGRLLGTIDAAALAHAAAGGEGGETALEIARTDPPVLARDAPLQAAIALMDGAGESHVPVIADPESRVIVGVVHEHDVMIRYRQALLQLHAEERGETTGRRRFAAKP